ncbi:MULTISPECIES: hypothetical protein [unclassified Colwellia]|jgi:hypothetical protein|uniref:hypothetical protein n=1 Tax=unclassified Colwellia TaxID=196834 RepID=UPI0015F709CD|nr:MULTISPECIES: hypothetical protein [unclassified Colwellia]MBA6231057.1 hypothetical protein [Colwellia sp. MB02u-7]MBA6234981.1 hypothetical protein [Colwellia sp. MB02u-11]MBA6297896.1 hypothetical protein [Colwellia sp. MB3u-22]MBA6309427.1 hypothetical protein [Colwellia sp. MB3u-64]MBA6399870.1 hypothetical protein [Colwellia sp. BRX10-4]
MSTFQASLIQDLIFISILIGLAVYLAKKRNRNIYSWGLAGVLIIPTLILFFLSKNEDV